MLMKGVADVSEDIPVIRFDNRFVRELPEDPEPENRSRQVTGACYSRVMPQKAPSPALVAVSGEMADVLGFDRHFCESRVFAEVFSGSRLMPGMEPYAACYGGHQFGTWAGQLGDGRAINLGEIISRDGGRWVIQLKGAGPTPYSRRADGLAVLRSSIREFLCSEAMFHLGVPTTRALSLVLTGDRVERDMFYDGHPKLEPGAVVCRVAPSFTRFGSFEIFAARGETDILKKLADYTLRTDFPHLGPPSKDVYIQWFDEICRRTADMIIHWMRVGFVHGVMNTDNMSILGLTLDFGPYGWLEGYDPGWTPNTTDAATRRYCFGNQPGIAHWNLARLASALHPLIRETGPLQEALDRFSTGMQAGWETMMAQKLGLDGFSPETDRPLINSLMEILVLAETDMTIFFRNLALVSPQAFPEAPPGLPGPLEPAFYRPEQITPAFVRQLENWIRAYLFRSRQDCRPPEERTAAMNRVNPKYVLRNYLAQMAADRAEEGDYSLVRELQDVLRRPYDDQPKKETLAGKRPEWARNRPGCSMLSCSS